MTDFPPSAHDSLYNRIWKTVGERVGYGIDCDTLTDKVIEGVNHPEGVVSYVYGGG